MPKNEPELERPYTRYLKSRDENALRRTLQPVNPAGRHITVASKTYLNFAGNDYLGLSQHPALIAGAQKWTADYGTGATASRLVTGNLAAFEQLEHKLAEFKNKPAALVFASGFQANATVIHALLDQKVLGGAPLVFFDKLNHASMHFGCWAARVSPMRYDHCDMEQLESLLDEHKTSAQPKFILSETVFSMDGDIAPLEKLRHLADQHGAMLVLDDAHATGILGKGGRGLSEKADIVIGTFSKAMGSFGAYVAASQTLCDFLLNRCTGMVYSTALAPPILGAIDAALDLVPRLGGARAKVAQMSLQLRQKLGALGLESGASDSQIVPVLAGRATDALTLADALKQKGIWCTAIRPPTVPDGKSRLRFTVTAAHRCEDIEALIQSLACSVTPKHKKTVKGAGGGISN